MASKDNMTDTQNAQQSVQSFPTIETDVNVVHKGKCIYSGKLFSESFCDQLTKNIYQQIDNHKQNSDTSKNKQHTLPNGITTDGYILSQFGMEKFHRQLRQAFAPIINKLYSKQFPNHIIVSDHSYIIRFRENCDRSLKPHCDDSDITINICIEKSDDLSGNEVYFMPDYDYDIQGTPEPPTRENYDKIQKMEKCNMKDNIDLNVAEEKLNNTNDDENSSNKENNVIFYEHVKGYGLIHTGNVTHGTMPLKKGCRTCLLYWAMLEDKEKLKDANYKSWKKTFYDELIKELQHRT